MKRSYYSSSKILGVALLAGLWTIACSSDEGSNNGTGGSRSATGGKASTGTTAPKTGGASSTSNTRTGGASPTGGVSSTTVGGTSSAGGTTSTSTSPGVGGVTGGGTTSGGGTHTGGTATGGIPATTAPTTTPCDASADAGPGCGGGYLKLYVPLAAANTGTDFEVDYGTSTTIDLANGTVTARVWVDAAGNAGGLRMYAKNDSVTNYATHYSTWANLADLDGKWTDIKIDASTITAGPVPPVNGTFDKSIVRWIGFNIAAGDAFDGGVFEPVTVYVDSVKFVPVTISDDINFTTSVEGFAVNTYNSPVASSAATWFAG